MTDYEFEIKKIMDGFETSFNQLNYKTSKVEMDGTLKGVVILQKKDLCGLYEIIFKKDLSGIFFGHPIINEDLAEGDLEKLFDLDEKIARELNFKEMDIEIEQENAREKLIKRGYKFKSETDCIGVKKLKWLH